MRIDLRPIETQCAVPGCTGDHLQRHHRGCEKMFVRHFSGRTGTPTYDAFRARYYRFEYRDIVTLCEDHHKEIHIHYLKFIASARRKIGKPMCRWTWKQAEILMRDLRQACKRWLDSKSSRRSKRCL